MPRSYIRLSIDQAKHFLEEAKDASEFRCADTQTDEEEKIRDIMLEILSHKIKRAEKRALGEAQRARA